MVKLVLQLPLPPRDLSPNRTRNVHWTKKAPQVADYRQSVMVDALNVIRSVGWEAPERVSIGLVWCLKGGRKAGLYCPMDADNAVGGSKTLFDGLRDAKAIQDDTWAHMKLAEVDVDRERGPYVEVTLSAA